MWSGTIVIADVAKKVTFLFADFLAALKYRNTMAAEDSPHGMLTGISLFCSLFVGGSSTWIFLNLNCT